MILEFAMSVLVMCRSFPMVSFRSASDSQSVKSVPLKEILTWKGIPTPEGNKEAKPAEEEHSTVHIDDIEEGYGPSLVVDGVDLRGRP
jgi:hypothetical protein